MAVWNPKTTGHYRLDDFEPKKVLKKFGRVYSATGKPPGPRQLKFLETISDEELESARNVLEFSKDELNERTLIRVVKASREMDRAELQAALVKIWGLLLSSPRQYTHYDICQHTLWDIIYDFIRKGY